MEVWKDVPSMGGYYEASSGGRIRTKRRVVVKLCGFNKKEVKQTYKARILSGSVGRHGHISVQLGFDGKKVNIQVGRLVLMAFVGMPQEGQECCHNNGIADDNRIENLRWDTHLANNRDRLKHGRYKRGVDHHFSKFSDELIENIRQRNITKKEALEAGVSNTHYYRILKKKS